MCRGNKGGFFMAGNYTQHYQLSQWQPQDRVLRTEFNQDNARLDGALLGLEERKAERTALTALAEAVAGKYGDDRRLFEFGSYVGDGGEGLRSIPVSFRPSFLILFNQNPKAGQYTYICALGCETAQCAIAASTGSCIQTELFHFTPQGVQVRGGILGLEYGFNTYGVSYQFAAIR